jgi:AcrR family transcriptional regulator
MARLWRSPVPPEGTRPGPKASLSLDAIVDGAIALADEAGGGSVSLRALAALLGCTPMALYTYVADRRELLDLMYDRAHAAMPEPAGDQWRDRVGAWSEAILECYLRHPWVVEVSFARSVLGPHEQRALELLLEALSPAGLDVADRATLVAALFGLARSMASTIADARRTAAAGDEKAWWAARTSALNEIVPDFAQRFPHSVALAGAPGTGDTAGATAWTARETDVGPWLEQPTREAFARAVAMLLDGAAPAAARAR